MLCPDKIRGEVGITKRPLSLFVLSSVMAFPNFEISDAFPSEEFVPQVTAQYGSRFSPDSILLGDARCSGVIQ
jgi:hypothetical protein